jgi:hypothetical protein
MKSPNIPSGLAATTPQQGMSLDRKERYCVAAPAGVLGAVPIFFPADGGGHFTRKHEIQLVVSSPLKNMKVSWDYYCQYTEKKQMFQTTNQMRLN